MSGQQGSSELIQGRHEGQDQRDLAEPECGNLHRTDPAQLAGPLL
jgi:hypothetical protein